MFSTMLGPWKVLLSEFQWIVLTSNWFMTRKLEIMVYITLIRKSNPNCALSSLSLLLLEFCQRTTTMLGVISCEWSIRCTIFPGTKAKRPSPWNNYDTSLATKSLVSNSSLLTLCSSRIEFGWSWYVNYRALQSHKLNQRERFLQG